jgi:hypothetical protein
MASTNVLNLTKDQFRVLYDILNDIYPQVKDPEPAFLELFDYVTEEYELTYAQFTLSPSVKAFAKAYPGQWSEWIISDSKEWREFKEAYDRMVELGFITPESAL